jgi:hypothetical protein
MIAAHYQYQVDLLLRVLPLVASETVFALEYHSNERLQPLVGEIVWSHNLAIMSKCTDPLIRIGRCLCTPWYCAMRFTARSAF